MQLLGAMLVNGAHTALITKLKLRELSTLNQFILKIERPTSLIFSKLTPRKNRGVCGKSEDRFRLGAETRYP